MYDQVTKLISLSLYALEFCFSSVIAHEYKDVLFHIMGHNCGKNEEYMWATMAEYIQTNEDGIKKVSEEYLKCKGQTLNDCLEFINVPGNKGNELAVHLLICMTNFKVVIITKTGY